MNPHIHQYITAIASRLKAGTATEHTYRGDLQTLLQALEPKIVATNEPKRQACGAPDYILTRNEIPVGYIEAKDIGVSLDKTEKTDQLKRYRGSLDNLLLTDYLEFRYFRNNEKVTTVALAKLEGSKIVPLQDNWPHFEHLVRDFNGHVSQTIKSAPRLAQMMAGKARLMQTVLQNALTADEQAIETGEQTQPTALYQQYLAFKEILLHDIKPAEFADIYAQTIAYGMFAARLHDQTLATFTRYEAAQLIPATNPFLRKLFQYIAGYDLDDRLVWIVDALADVFRATDIKAILKNFGRSTQTHDPIIHFYETFLSEYNPALRKSRGVWYTPEPVVNFIIRAVDDILKTEFNLPDGLASTDTTEIEVATQLTDKRTTDKVKKGKQTVHKVQVLDPATGTGTFLAEVVKHIYQDFVEKGQEGIWSQYVEKHLLPRLNGFEILMASYAMCHLKLDLLLNETGYQPQNPRRFKVYLTNSLEEAAPSQLSLFATWLSDEAMQANAVKRETPVMVVLGNPPYSGISSNNGKWISDLIEDYKYVDGVHFGEKKHWLQDDYVKFMRFGEFFVEKNGEGILAYINNHGFLDNPTFKGMRWHLLNTFDKIYIVDLHGNAKKKEVSPDGSADKNVFDIQQGVSINILIKTGRKKKVELAEVFHCDAWGSREGKYDFLLKNDLKKISFTKIENEEPFYFFMPKNYEGKEEFEAGFKLTELFPINSVGFVTGRDSIMIGFDRKTIESNMNFIIDNNDSEIRLKFNLNSKDARDWTVPTAKKDAISNFAKNKIVESLYRPFDKRFTFYSGNSRGVFASPQKKIMNHLVRKNNYGLVVGRQGQVVGSMQWNLVYVSDKITDFNLFYRGGGVAFPLYLYPESNTQTQLDGLQEARKPNLEPKVVSQISAKTGLPFEPEKTNTATAFAPIDLLDYIYAVLHSPAYRERYKEFLKIDFPRVPYPQNAAHFFRLAALGAELRQLHLLEHPTAQKPITKYPASGNNVVEKLSYTATENGLGSVHINPQQYFANVPQVAWEFYIGGYQPAQKWLKDRKGRELQIEDIQHYQRIIVALSRTSELIKEIDGVIDLA